MLMKISINGELREIADGSTLYEVLCDLSSDPPPQGIAVALNSEVIPRKQWPSTILSVSDTLEILWASSGG